MTLESDLSASHELPIGWAPIFGADAGSDSSAMFCSIIHALLPQTRVVVDVGCGRGGAVEVLDGTDPLDFRGAGRRVIGIDVDPVGADNPVLDEFRRIAGDRWPLEDESVDLVLHAFFNAQPGDLFVKKAPACTVEVLARAVARVLGQDDPDIRVIGTRHGEKQHETLLSQEEKAKAIEQGDYFRVPLDARSLEYELYTDEGDRDAVAVSDYTSANTTQLDVDGACELLLRLPEIQSLRTGQAS